MTTHIHLDFETYSEAPLRGQKSVGGWIYANHPSTEVLCCAYALGNEPPLLWRPGEPAPDIFRQGGDYIFHAHNAQFEFYIWNYVLRSEWGSPPPFDQWRCTAAQAAALALPRSLAEAGKAVGLAADDSKDARGKYLIDRLCKPYRGKRNSDPDLLEELYAYCEQDVIAERALGKRLLPLRPSEQALWELDQVINLRGIPVDQECVEHAICLYEACESELRARLSELTGVENPNSTVQLLDWLERQGAELPSLAAAEVRQFLEAIS